MERDAIGLQAKTLGEVQHVDSHLRIATEFARQRPLGAGAVVEDTAEHAGAGRGTRDLLHLCGAVDREQADAERMRPRDIALLLDGVAERDAVRGCAGIQRHLDFLHRRAVEARAHGGEQRQHFRRRVGLHRVEHAGVRQRLGEGLEVVTHDFEVDHETRLEVLTFVAAGTEEFLDTFSHSTLPNGPATGLVQKMMTVQLSRTQTRDGGAAKPKVQTVSAAVDWWE